MCPQDGASSTAVGSGPRFRGVGEGEGGGVDDSIIADERDRNLNRLSHPAPTLPEGGNVRHHTQDALPTSVHGVSLHISEPHSEVGGEVLSSQL